jgi:hypothetical protein
LEFAQYETIEVANRSNLLAFAIGEIDAKCLLSAQDNFDQIHAHGS